MLDERTQPDATFVEANSFLVAAALIWTMVASFGTRSIENVNEPSEAAATAMAAVSIQNSNATRTFGCKRKRERESE